MTFFFQTNIIGVILKHVLALPSSIVAVNGAELHMAIWDERCAFGRTPSPPPPSELFLSELSI